MSKYTDEQVMAMREHRGSIIGIHYIEYAEKNVSPVSITNHNVYVYPFGYPSYSEKKTLDDNQVGVFMSSTQFDRQLFDMLAQIIGIDADDALMMSLS